MSHPEQGSATANNHLGPATAASFAPTPLGSQRRLAAGYEAHGRMLPFVGPFVRWSHRDVATAALGRLLTDHFQDGVVRIWRPAAPRIDAESGCQ